jgi:hypothetical protein
MTLKINMSNQLQIQIKKTCDNQLFSYCLELIVCLYRNEFFCFKLSEKNRTYDLIYFHSLAFLNKSNTTVISEEMICSCQKYEIRIRNDLLEIMCHTFTHLFMSS